MWTSQFKCILSKIKLGSLRHQIASRPNAHSQTDWAIEDRAKTWGYCINTLKQRQNCHFAHDILKCIFLNENIWITLKISLKFVPKVIINNIPALTALVQITAWRRPGDKPLSETMMVSLLTHICVTRPQWVKHNPASHCLIRGNICIDYP